MAAAAAITAVAEATAEDTATATSSRAAATVVSKAAATAVATEAAAATVAAAATAVRAPGISWRTHPFGQRASGWKHGSACSDLHHHTQQTLKQFQWTGSEQK